MVLREKDDRKRCTRVHDSFGIVSRLGCRYLQRKSYASYEGRNGPFYPVVVTIAFEVISAFNELQMNVILLQLINDLCSVAYEMLVVSRAFELVSRSPSAFFAKISSSLF